MLQFQVASFNLKCESEETLFLTLLGKCTSSHIIFSVCCSLDFERSDFCIVKVLEWEPGGGCQTHVSSGGRN